MFSGGNMWIMWLIPFILIKLIINGKGVLRICGKFFKVLRMKKSTPKIIPVPKIEEGAEETPLHLAMLCYLSYLVLTVFGHLRDFMRKTGIEKTFGAVEKDREGYVPLYQSFQSFYTRNVYRRICDSWCLPISSVPGPVITIKKREFYDYKWKSKLLEEHEEAINFGSYNYLGFAKNSGPCADAVEKTIYECGVSIPSSRHELGAHVIHNELEALVSRFLGVEDSVVFGMGFATNSTNIPTLAGKGTLIISDELNHASLVLGCRLSGATIKVFKHNDMKNLERVLRDAIAYGRPRTHRSWEKIVIVVEGLYSMEGDIVDLPKLIALKKKYRAYLYVDEAHSVGALGRRGRGVIDHHNCNPRDVDLLMGTFTKSFGAAGGYIAGNKTLISHLRRNSHSFTYATSMSPAIAQQILSTMRIIMGEDGTDEGQRLISNLARNTQYFRKRLQQLGFIIYGNDSSPVVPLLLYMPAKLTAFLQLLMKRGVATVVVGFPGTSLIEGRSRFCLSAAHTKEMLDKALDVISEVGEMIHAKSSRRILPKIQIEY